MRQHRRGLSIGLTTAALLVIARTACPQGTWKVADASMRTPRDAHAVLLLQNRVLIVGGRIHAGGTTTAQTDYYDPVARQFHPTGNMRRSRSFFPMVLLDNGKILAPGGYRQHEDGRTIRDSELFDPESGKWTRTGDMTVPRELHTATKLPNGSVLIVGGFSNNHLLRSAELYLTEQGRFRLTGAMRDQRFGHTASWVEGKVFVAGGRAPHDRSLQSTEFYHPDTETWTVGPLMSYDRFRHTATTLRDGRILITGGYSSSELRTLATAEIYDPKTNAFRLVTNPRTGLPLSMSDARMDHAAALLPDGRVLLVGGWSSVKGCTVASADLFDPTTVTFTRLPALPVSRHELCIQLLPDGTALLTGGLRWEPGNARTLDGAYLYAP